MTLSEQLLSFNGRLNRQPWWILGISVSAVAVVLQVVVSITLGTVSAPGEAGAPPGMAGGGLAGIIVLIVSLAALWINLALTAKRFHDRDKSAWWILIGLIPVVGALWILVDCGFLKGTEGDNRFGANPLAT
ncbi:MAG: DUF805 domain-containing protein [Gammaproteobacteria bacterium]|nr:DUF805 domain-containing protein [Gammaproteobacteria bacterium]